VYSLPVLSPLTFGAIRSSRIIPSGWCGPQFPQKGQRLPFDTLRTRFFRNAIILILTQKIYITMIYSSMKVEFLSNNKTPPLIMRSGALMFFEHITLI